MRLLLPVVVAAAAVAGCGGGGGDGGGTTAPPVAVSSVAITPSAAQSIIVGQTISFSAQPRDAQGNSLNRAVTWTTSDASKVSLSSTAGVSVTATGVAVGSSVITATSESKPSTAVTVTVTQAGPFPNSASVDATTSDTFVPASVDIAAGGTVTWTFAKTHNVTFGSNKPTGGDIGNTNSGSASRTFPNAGSYPYTCTLHAGMNGTVVVH
jgi:plastocyanin